MATEDGATAARRSERRGAARDPHKEWMIGSHLPHLTSSSSSTLPPHRPSLCAPFLPSLLPLQSPWRQPMNPAVTRRHDTDFSLIASLHDGGTIAPCLSVTAWCVMRWDAMPRHLAFGAKYVQSVINRVKWKNKLWESVSWCSWSLFINAC